MQCSDARTNARTTYQSSFFCLLPHPTEECSSGCDEHSFSRVENALKNFPNYAALFACMQMVEERIREEEEHLGKEKTKIDF